MGKGTRLMMPHSMNRREATWVAAGRRGRGGGTATSARRPSRQAGSQPAAPPAPTPQLHCECCKNFLPVWPHGSAATATGAQLHERRRQAGGRALVTRMGDRTMPTMLWTISKTADVCAIFRGSSTACSALGSTREALPCGPLARRTPPAGRTHLPNIFPRPAGPARLVGQDEHVPPAQAQTRTDRSRDGVGPAAPRAPAAHSPEHRQGCIIHEQVYRFEPRPGLGCPACHGAASAMQRC